MAKSPKDNRKIRPDANEIAYRVLQEALGDAPKTKPPEDRTDVDKHPEAVKRGREGGKKGGPARKQSLSKQERSEIARKAARGRWDRDGK